MLLNYANMSWIIWDVVAIIQGIQLLPLICSPHQNLDLFSAGRPSLFSCHQCKYPHHCAGNSCSLRGKRALCFVWAMSCKSQEGTIKPIAGLRWGLDNCESLMIHIILTRPCQAWLLSILYFLHLNSSCRVEACGGLGPNQLLKLQVW